MPTKATEPTTSPATDLSATAESATSDKLRVLGAAMVVILLGELPPGDGQRLLASTARLGFRLDGPARPRACWVFT